MKEKKKQETFSFGDVEHLHKIGNIDCPECWEGYPKKCRCGGLIHAQFKDEDYEGNYSLDEQCDRCGLAYEPILPL